MKQKVKELSPEQIDQSLNELAETFKEMDSLLWIFSLPDLSTDLLGKTSRRSIRLIEEQRKILKKLEKCTCYPDHDFQCKLREAIQITYPWKKHLCRDPKGQQIEG